MTRKQKRRFSHLNSLGKEITDRRTGLLLLTVVVVQTKSKGKTRENRRPRQNSDLHSSASMKTNEISANTSMDSRLGLSAEGEEYNARRWKSSKMESTSRSSANVSLRAWKADVSVGWSTNEEGFLRAHWFVCQ